MQPIAAPTTIPLVAIVASAETTSATPSAMTGDGQPVAAQASLVGEGSSVFALLLAPLAMPVDGTAATTTAVVAQLATPVEDGLAALLAPAAPDAATDGKDTEDSALLALLAAYSATPAPTTLPTDAPVRSDCTDTTTSAQPLASSADLACTALLTQLSAMSVTGSTAPSPTTILPATPEALPQTATPAAPIIPGQAVLPSAAPTQAQPAPVPVEEASPATSLAQALAALGEARPSQRAAPRMTVPTAPAAVSPTTSTDVEMPAVAQPSITPEVTSAIPEAMRREDKPAAEPVPATVAVDDSAALAAGQLPTPTAATAAATPPTAIASNQTVASPAPSVAGAANPVATPEPVAATVTSATADISVPATKPAVDNTPATEVPTKAVAETATSAAPTTASVSTPRPEPLAAVQRGEATTATPRAEANPLDRAVAHQVSRAILQHLPDGGTRMVMRLTPPELGTVRIEFLSRDGMMTARLMAEDEGVRQALDRALPQIRADVRTDQPTLNITVERGDQRQAWDEGHARQQQRDDQRSSQGGRRGDDEPVFSIDGVDAPAPTALPTRTTPVLGGRVTNATIDALA